MTCPLLDRAVDLRRLYPQAQGIGSKMLAILIDRHPRAVTWAALSEALFDLTGERPSRGALGSGLKRLRKALPPGVRVVTICGDGVALETPEGWIWP